MNKNFLCIFGYIFLFMGCEIDQTENDVYGCCHSDAWNYNSDVTVHVDSVCIYDFTFTNPTENSIWTVGNNEAISWLGGDSNISIRISMVDSSTDLNEIVISAEVPNTGNISWTVDVGNYSPGEKKLYFIQDINSDGIIDTVNDLITYSNTFTVNAINR